MSFAFPGWAGAVRCLPALLAAGLALAPPVSALSGLPTEAQEAPPLVGFSFVPRNAVYAGVEAGVGLERLLRELNPDLVRMPVYWNEVEPRRGAFDFGVVDASMAVIAKYNQSAARAAHVVLTVGARNLSYPEIYLPAWVTVGPSFSLAEVERSQAYSDYTAATFKRYAGSPLLYAWQLENEGLDDVNSSFAHKISLPVATVAAEVGALRAVDPAHKVVISTFNSSHVDLDKRDQTALGWLWAILPGAHASGHPQQALKLGDALGLDMYVATPYTPLQEVSAPIRIQWKADALSFWGDIAGTAGKQLWVTEMQAYPWSGLTTFTRSDLHLSALSYRDRGVSAVLLWGVENWLAHPEWMSSGKDALALLRDPG